MSVLVAIMLVAVVGWVFLKAGRSGRPGSARADGPAWPGEATPPETFRPIGDAPATGLVSTPRVQVTVRRPDDAFPARGLAAVSQAQAAATAGLPRGAYPLSSQPQRRRPDRSARLFAHARGPGLCSPRTRT